MANNLTTPPANTLAFPQQPTAKELFLKSRDTSWADKFGGVTPYYPQQRYIDENLAPNLNITNMQLEALAQANQIARKNKLMSPKLLDAMLPTLLVEGASGTRGWGYPDTPEFQALRDKAGLTDNKRNPTLTTNAAGDFVLPTEYDRQLREAQMMHAMMAAKEKEYGTDLAIERWNGEGVTKRGDAIYADAKNHARKVEELTRLLADPKNAPMVRQWQALNARYAGAGPQEVREAPPVWNWEDYAVPGILGVPIAAARETLPSTNILRDIRRGIRNWTAPE
ncbi:hypothetical protein UFOVP501_51 [uncultured Caudovirales phage]|uniref:Uncharacterized protein n=1 Tax=uncultured Caudovirales phage TaxID=2100421 RepID=A0A6J5MNK1_9CAUD|nr:hypothetical protein UFOVP501_51 [uncultured Caudovirales phage]CAB4161446.1 hypothetical protein UFOVP762_52 [uncultured Caudovirales phage]CAB4187539.1 hypothetical protein UFOVP1161_51 [uncultured Caudovirales phage]